MHTYLTWARSLLAPRDRLLPGLGARLARHPRLIAGLLVGLRRLPPGRTRAAAFRHVSKPLLTRVHTGLEVPVFGGSRMVVDTSDLIGRVLAISGVWEIQVTEALRTRLAPGDVCIDIGAHVGYFTLLASKLVGPSGHVYAFEPAPRSYSELCSNLELNSVTNVTAFCLAAGDRDGRELLYESPSGNTGASSIRPLLGAPAVDDDPLRTTTVETRRADAVVPASDLPRVSLVKIDVEGYEAEVLRGVEAIFEAGGRPAIIVEVTLARSGEEGAAQVMSFAAKHGLKVYRLVDEGLLSGRSPRRPRTPIEVASISRGREELLLAPDGASVHR